MAVSDKAAVGGNKAIAAGNWSFTQTIMKWRTTVSDWADSNGWRGDIGGRSISSSCTKPTAIGGSAAGGSALWGQICVLFAGAILYNTASRVQVHMTILCKDIARI